MYIANVLQPLVDACQWVLEWWHDVIGDGPNSWGWSIILLTFTVRIFILPLTFKGVKSMQRLQVLQPEIKKIQERFKDDKQRQQQEVMAFYQKEKVNPLGSCLPLLLQIPFFIALFSLLRSNAFQEDIASNPGFFAIHDLAEKVTDPWLLGVLIVLYVGTQLAASAVTAISADPMQRRIMLASAVRVRRLHHQLPGRPHRLLDHHQRVDDRAAADGAQALSQARHRGRARGGEGHRHGRQGQTGSHSGRGRGGGRRRHQGRQDAEEGVEEGEEGEGDGEGDGRGACGRRQRRLGQGTAALAAQEEEALRAPSLSAMSVGEEPRPEELVAEAEGESLGEAKWAAVKALEPRFPGISAESIRFDVTEEPAPDRPARVRAEVDLESWRDAAGRIPDEPAERVRAMVARVVHALGLRATVDITESEDEIRATVNGDELGLLIGKHGATIDALQHLAFRAGWSGAGDRKQVTVDAAGYRERRAAALHRMADRAAAEAVRYDRPVELEPMRATERRIVHTYLSERDDVETHSEGDEPDRRLVVSPSQGF